MTLPEGGVGQGTSPASMGEEPDRVVMGRVSGPYGVQGWVKVEPWSESVSTVAGYPRWWMRRGGQWTQVVVERALVHGRHVVARLQGCADRDQAFAWRGAEVAIERSLLPAPGPGEFYWTDLVGLQVQNAAGESLGKIAELFSNGAHEVLRVVEQDADGEVERLIPFVAAIVTQVSIESGVVRVQWERHW